MRMVYSEALMDHFQQPRHVGRLDGDAVSVGTGMAGAVETGGVLRIQIRVGPDGLITDTRFKAYGPPALIASGSWLADTVRGLELSAAETISHQVIAEALGLPPERLHCALLAEDAIRAAINEYKEKQRAYA